MSRMYANAGCHKLIKENEQKPLIDAVYEDAELRRKTFGDSKFCDGNMKEYVELAEIINQHKN